MKPGGPYVEIKVGRWRYRFFGRGVWQYELNGEWLPINGIHVHAEALAVAAKYVTEGNEATFKIEVFNASGAPPTEHMVEGKDGKPTTHFERYKEAGEAPGGGVTVGMPAVKGTGQDDP